MAPRISLVAARPLAFRTKPTIPQKRFARGPRPGMLQQQTRTASDDASKQPPAKTFVPPQFKGPNMDQLPHVTEEQAAMDQITGESPPDVEQGTPVQEILQRDKDAQKHAPQVLKQELKQAATDSKSNPSGSRSFSTSARRSHAAMQSHASKPPTEELIQFQETRAVGLEYPDAGFGHKFGLPDLTSLGKAANFKKRYDPVIQQVTRSLMRDGKLSRAQKDMDFILDALRTSSPPATGVALGSPDRELLSPIHGSSLPLSPVAYLTAIIDSVAPVVKIRQQKGILGGGASMPIPIPLRERSRRRTAIQWILQSAQGRKELKFAERVAKELLSVAEGRSSAWEKRGRVHKMAIGARANTKIAMGGRRVKRKGGGK